MNKKNVLIVTVASLSVLATSAISFMSGTTLEEITPASLSKIMEVRPQTNIEEYTREEFTDKRIGGDGGSDSPPERREVSGNRIPVTPSAPLDVTDTKSLCWKSLKDAGFSDASAAAIMSNIEVESSFNPLAVNASGFTGLFQLSPSNRLPGLKTAHPNDWNTAAAQMDYFNTEWAGFGYSSYCSDSYYNRYNYSVRRNECIAAGYNIPSPFTLTTKEAFMASSDVAECVFLFRMGFERPGSGDNKFVRCMGIANQYLATFGGRA